LVKTNVGYKDNANQILSQWSVHAIFEPRPENWKYNSTNDEIKNFKPSNDPGDALRLQYFV